MARKKEPGPARADVVKAQNWATFAISVIDRVGWPGLLVLALASALKWWGTEDQHRRFVEAFILGNGINNIWPLVLLGATFAATVVAQHHVYRKKVHILESEVDRIGNEKSLLQQELSARKLSTSKSQV